MSESTHTPESTSPDATTSTTTEAVTPTDTRSRTRTFLFAGGAVVAAAVLAGGGVALGAAIADDDDDLDNASLTANSSVDAADDSRADDDTAASGDTASDDIASDDIANDDSTADGSAAAGVTGAASAAALSEIIAAAAEVADGSAVGIDAERDGSWDVSFETASGDETEVRVTTDGNASVISTEVADADDKAPQGSLDAKTVDALVAAALAEVDGTITDLDIDDDPTSPYDISVLTRDGQSVDIELDAQMAVLSVERD